MPHRSRSNSARRNSRSRSRSNRKRSSSRESRSRSGSSYSYSSYSSRSSNGSEYSYSDSYSDSSSDNKYGKEKKGEKRVEKTIPTNESTLNGNDEEKKEKESPNYKTTGALGKDKNTGVMYNGVLLKWCEPPDAAKPNSKWRVYEFKGEELLDTKYMHRCSAFLIGRDERVCDWILLHESISKQHAVFQYRKVPYNANDRSEFRRMVIKPYIMDLDSSNGTFLNGKKLEGSRYYELRDGDELRFGGSTRRYIVMNESMNVVEKVEKEENVKSDHEDMLYCVSLQTRNRFTWAFSFTQRS